MAIVTVTLNPALDLETRTRELVPGQKLRCAPARRDPGGGGINVARAITLLGGAATAAVAVGGPIGRDLMARLDAPGLTVAALPAPGETRENLSVIEEKTGAQFRFIFPGPRWSRLELDQAVRVLSPMIKPGDLVVLSGSMPPGLPPETLVELARDLKEAGGQIVCDTSGEALHAVAAAGLGLKVLRMDSAEANELAGQDLIDTAASAGAARRLVNAGAAEIVVLARGAEGSVLVTRDEAWFAPAAKVPVVSMTGAGDSFVAGMSLALSRGLPLPEVLSWGVSAASAAVTTEATELCDKATFDAVLPQSGARPV